MNFKLFTIVGLTALLFTACGINDLEDRLDKVENALGTNEPLKLEFSTKTSQDEAIIKNTSFLFKAKGYNEYVENNQNGTFDVYIERFADVNWNEGAWIYFTYNPTTKAITNASSGPYFYDKYGRWINPNFSPNNAGNTLTLTVNSFDGETGKVNVTVVASTTPDAGNNEYVGKAMSMKLTFKGQLPVYID